MLGCVSGYVPSPAMHSFPAGKMGVKEWGLGRRGVASMYEGFGSPTQGRTGDRFSHVGLCSCSCGAWYVAKGTENWRWDGWATCG